MADQVSSRLTVDPGLTSRLCAALNSIRLDDIPQPVVERARYVMLDGIGCGLVGARLPWSVLAVRALADLEPPGAATVWGWDLKLAAPAAATLNGSFVQGFELDDYHPVGPLHSASIVVTSALATAEQAGGVSWDRFLRAVVLGFEIGPRIAIAMDADGLLSRGFHCGAVYGTVPAAVAASIVRGLDDAALEDAIGIAATQSAGLMAAQYEAMVKRMHHGFAARSGIYAAALAAAGFTGIKGVLEREYGGLISSFAPGRLSHADGIVEDLGQRWEAGRIAVKPYACMAGIHAAIDAVLDLREELGLVPSDVRRMRITVPEAMFKHGGWPLERPATVIGAQMNIAYGAAVALLDGAALVAQFTPKRVDSDDVWDCMNRIEVVPDEPDGTDGQFTRLGARVEVETSSGIAEKTFAAPNGTAKRTFSNAEVLTKFRKLTAAIIDGQRQSAIEQLVLSPAERDTRGLADLLGQPVTAIF